MMLVAQPLPELPPVQPFSDAPDRPEFLLYRPWSMEEESTPTEPLQYRGEKVLNSPNGYQIEHGAIQSKELLLLADRIQFDPKTNMLVAEGNIRLEGLGLRLRCERLKMDWLKRSGEAWALVMEIDPDRTLQSDHAVFTSLRHWDFEQVQVSSCPQDKPGWSTTMSRLKLDLDEYATFSNVKLFVGPMPVFYLPWGTYPVKEKRSSGLLPTIPGYSNVVGVALPLSYYQTFGEAMDATISPQLHSKENPLWGGEFRWHPEPTHMGAVQGQYIKQQKDDVDRYRYQFRDLWQREDGWRFSADINQASDSLVEADFGKGVGGVGGVSFDSAVYVGKNFPLASFSIQASENRSFFDVEDDPLAQASTPSSLRKQTLPELQSRLYPKEFGDFYFDAGVRAGHLAYRLEFDGEAPTDTYEWNREDIFGRLQGRLGQWGPFRADLQTLVRATNYGASLSHPLYDTDTNSFGETLDPDFNPYVVDGESIQRFLGSGRLHLSGPQLGRHFNQFKFFNFRGELKHTVEPYMAFTETTRSGDEAYIPRYDEVDSRPGAGGSAMGEESLEMGVMQHFLGRPGRGDLYADLVRWKLSTKYHFRPILLSDGRYKDGWASVDSVIDAEPNKRIRISFRNSRDLEEGASDTSLSLDVKTAGDSRFNLAIFSTAINSLLVKQKGIQFGGLQRLWNDRVRLEFQANHDYHRMVSSQVALAYVTTCVATSIRFSQVSLDDEDQGFWDNRFDFVVSLKNLGDFTLFNN